MKKIRNILVVTAFLTALGGCESAIDVNPTTQITGGTFGSLPDDARAYAVGIYASFRALNNTTLYGEDRSDLWESGLTGRISSNWSQVITPSNVTANWAAFYTTLHQCNLFLRQIEPITFQNAAEKNRLKAQVLFIRAHTYFTLARTWGDVPIVLEPILSASAVLPGRSPVADVFKQINADIDQALTLFPEEGYVDKYRASKPATYALQVDVKMWTAKVLAGGNADLQAALTAIGMVEKSGVTLLPKFTDVFGSANKKNAEIILSIAFSRNETNSTFYGRNAIPTLLTTGGYDNGSEIAATNDQNFSDPAYAPSAAIKNLLSVYPGDVRRAGSYVEARVKGTVVGTFGNKFRGTRYSDGIYEDDDLILYRLADMILLKAEALIALGRSAEAVLELNKVRNRAGIGPYTGLTDIKTLDLEILQERGRELFHENKRWYDLLRANAAKTIDIYQFVPNLRGKTTPLYLPVTPQVISLNANVSQTTGY